MTSGIKKILFILITASLVLSLSKSIISYKDKLNFYHEDRVDYLKAEEENKKLKSELKKGSDYYYIETQIREKLNRLKPNEVAIIMPPISPTPTPTPVIIKKPYEQWRDLLVR